MVRKASTDYSADLETLNLLPKKTKIFAVFCK